MMRFFSGEKMKMFMSRLKNTAKRKEMFFYFDEEKRTCSKVPEHCLEIRATTREELERLKKFLLKGFDLEKFERQQWHPIYPDDPESFPPVGADGESEYIEISCENWEIPCIGLYREDETGGAFYNGDSEMSMESYGLIVNAWRYADPYVPEEE